MNQAKKRSLIILLSIGLLIGSGIMIFSYIIPKINEVQLLRGENNELVILVQEQTETVSAVNNLLDKYVNVPELKESLSLSLPRDTEIPGVVNQFQGIASLSGVAIESLDLRELPIEPSFGNNLITPIGIIEITLNAKSTYESLKLYIENIETNIRVMDIKSIQAEVEDESDIISYNLVVRTYYQR